MQEKIYSWGHKRRYNDYSSYIKKTFETRVQKLSLNTGFTCPNRDGTKGRGGCTYCNNKSFNPDYCEPEKSIKTQLEQGVNFFIEKYKTQKYLAYFQAYTNTYAAISILKKMYDEALAHPLVVGLVIATRPDCVNNEILDLIASYTKDYYTVVEYGTESTLNRTLDFVNRGHSYEDTVEAVMATHERGIKTGLHMILGLPGESKQDIISHAKTISALPVHTLKLHQLQIIEGTVMAKQFAEQPGLFHNFSAEEYIDLVVEFLENLSPQIIIERFISESPRNMLISPRWGLKNFEVVDKIDKRLKELGTHQARLYK